MKLASDKHIWCYIAQCVTFIAGKLQSLNTEAPKRLQILSLDVIACHYGTKVLLKHFTRTL